MKKVISWFKRFFLYRVVQKDIVTSDGTLIIRTYVTNSNYSSAVFIKEKNFNNINSHYTAELKYAESYRYNYFSC